LLLSVIGLVSSLLLFLVLDKKNYFYNTIIQKVYNLVVYIYFETNLIIFIGVALNKFGVTTFDGYCLIWAIITILISILELSTKMDFDNFDKVVLYPYDALSNMLNFIYLIDNKQKSQYCSYIVEGYIFKHENSCNFKECSLKVYKDKYYNNSEQGITNDDSKKLLISHCNKLYEQHIEK
jgi:hypothetical protein